MFSIIEYAIAGLSQSRRDLLRALPERVPLNTGQDNNIFTANHVSPKGHRIRPMPRTFSICSNGVSPGKDIGRK